MKNTIGILVAGLAGFGIAAVVVSNRLTERHRAETARAQATWDAEKAALEAAIAKGGRRERATIALPREITRLTNTVSAAEILRTLQALRTSTNSPRSARFIIHQFEALRELGPEALPAIREFLAESVDVEYDSGPRRGFRDGKIPTEFTFPPSLRLGLLEIVKSIGSEGGEQLLAEVLSTTRKGAELAYTAYSLQQLAPNKYRDAALTAARELLARQAPENPSSPLDKFEREYLYGVLNFFGDTTYVASAQAQMIQPSGRVDAVAVRYLQQTLGTQAIALAAQAWNDTRVAADQKEPLARVALTYAGLDPQADQLYQTAINDANLPPAHRKNLIEDLNEAGFADPKHLTPADAPLIEKRIAMIEQLAPSAMDQVNADAFKEAYKDLVKMHQSLQPKLPK